MISGKVIDSKIDRSQPNSARNALATRDRKR